MHTPGVDASTLAALRSTIKEDMSGTSVRAISALLLALAAWCLAPASAVNYSLPQRLPGDCLSAGITVPAGGLFPAQLIGGTTPMPGGATMQVVA